MKKKIAKARQGDNAKHSQVTVGTGDVDLGA
jgi:hypothetical protein